MKEFLVAEAIRDFTGQHRFLSNFHMSPVLMGDGITYPSSEHAFQAQKTLDRGQRAQIASMATPGEAKGAGRHVDLRPDWERVKKQIMLRVVIGKFTRSADLAACLCATGRAPLVEGNSWHDNFWGNCRCGRLSCDGAGLNYLGQILMSVRMILREDL